MGAPKLTSTLEDSDQSDWSVLCNDTLDLQACDLSQVDFTQLPDAAECSPCLAVLSKAVALLISDDEHYSRPLADALNAAMERKKKSLMELDAAARALDCLPSKDWREMKALNRPPKGVADVMAAVLCLLGHPPKERSWGHAMKAMSRIDTFMQDLILFNKVRHGPQAVPNPQP